MKCKIFCDNDATMTPTAAAPSTEKSTNKQSATSQSRKSFHLNESSWYQNTVSKYSKVGLKCPACLSDKRDHRLRLCPKFKIQIPQQRRNCIETNSLCFNYFNHSHSASSCNSTYDCLKCQGKHHTMLHIETESPAQPSTVTSNLVVGITNSVHLFKHVIPATALIDVKAHNGIW